jgi:hypothetical protein
MATERERSPTQLGRDLLRSGWRTALTVYYANSPAWRLLKSGALLFLGFFAWAGSNILASYQAGWGWLTYPMAYGFLLIGYGPVHHAVVIPLALRWRRASGRLQTLGRHLPNGMLATFLAAVLVLGTFPAGPMVVDFSSALEDGGADIDPDMHCVKSETASGTQVHCHLSEGDGVHRLEVVSGGETIATVEQAPWEFTIPASDLATTMDSERFTVVLQDENGDTVRRYTRTLRMIASD